MPSILNPPSPPIAPKPPSPPPLSMRDFGDSGATRKSIYDQALQAAQSIEPVTNKQFSLGLSEVDWADPEEITIADQKKAILEGRSLTRRLRGTWTMTDPAGNMIAKKKATIAAVPHLTHRGTFIVNGNEYTLAHQMRLRPGVFTRVKENGEIEGHINVLPGKGVSHRYFLEPSTGIFKIQIGQSSMPLLSAMRALGATDKEIRDAWGKDGAELLATNMMKDDPKVIDKLYTKLIGARGTASSFDEKSQAVAAALSGMELDPEVTKRTLGHPYAKLDKSAVLAATSKLLAVSRGEQPPDDRDHLAYQQFLGPEDLIAERLGRDKRVMTDLLWKSTYHKGLDRLPAGAFTGSVNAAILDSGLGQAIEEINPSDVFDQQTRVSRLGYGGIPSLDAVPDEARSVQPSHLNFIDLLRTPESFKAGVDSRVGYAARKGSDRRVYSPFLDKTGKVTYKSPQDVADSVVAFPQEMERISQFATQEQMRPGSVSRNDELVAAMVHGKVRMVPAHTVDFVMPHMEQAFSPINNLVPLKSALKGQRAAMASRFITQALPIAGGESPFVRGAVPGSNGLESFEEKYGRHMGAAFADNLPGRVVDVGPDHIAVRYADGQTKKHEIYHNFPYNRKTYLHSTPMVRPGDPINPGQILAKSNYTDDKGSVALGLNTRFAYIPFRGLNYEDAYVVSESYAKRLASEHMYQHVNEWDPDKDRRGKRTFTSIFPSEYDRKALDKLDDDGIVKEGMTVGPGDPLVLLGQVRDLSHKQVHASHKGSFANRSLTWDHHGEGIVTDVAKTSKGVTVAVKAITPTQVGDKISGRMGDKGVISAIIPDHEMPHDEQNRPFEVLGNPLGIISRTNPNQAIEAALGKIAERTGKPYKIEDFKNIKDLTEFAIKELDRYGISDTETLTDPLTGRKIPNVFTGNRYIMKLHHTSESKGQGRGLGAYTAEDSPARGGDEGSKKLALMDVNALLSHGATEVLRDAKMVRGQKNQEYWSMFMAGHTPPTPKVPLVYEKFVNQLRGAGVNVVRDGPRIHVMAMTDKTIAQLAGDREIKNVETVDWKTGLKPIAGGLFDVMLTGGHGGNRWSFIKLAEPLPSPVMEEPIRRVLGLTQKKFEEVLSGQEKLGDATGPQAIAQALDRINLPMAIHQAREDIKSGRKTVRDVAIRKLGFLKGAEKAGIHPRDWILSRVPVLPPIFRPVSIMQGSGGQLVNDANYLYKEVFDANQALQDLKPVTADIGAERLNLYKSFKAVTGLGDPIQPKNQERGVKGMLDQIFGFSPKFGTVQQKLLGTTVDLVGRAVVVPNPDLDMDQVGLPEGRAWEVYTPFVVRRLVRRGVGRIQALQYVRDRNPIARKALLDELDERPVLVNRAPVLHRYGLMAFWPRLTKGDVLQVPPLVVGGFNMDFDGDASNYHVPATDEARDEAVQKMLPSKNLFSVSSLNKPMYQMRQEYVGGLHAATSRIDTAKRPRVFAKKQDAMNAYWRGELDPDQKIEILE